MTSCITGRESQRTPQDCTVAAATALSISSATYANEVHVQHGIWKEWNDFNDHFEYYRHRSSSYFHQFICIRRLDKPSALRIDLQVYKEEKDKGKWFICVRRTTWNPRGATVSKSKHKWHAAVALKAVHKYAPEFGAWNILNNCGTWAKEVIQYMSSDDHRRAVDCDPIIDYVDLAEFGSEMGIELVFIKRDRLQSYERCDNEEMAEVATDHEVIETNNATA